MAFFEFRNYFVRDGQMDAWLSLMQDEIIPFAVECGTVFCGSFVDLEDPTAYHWIRRFEDEAHREKIYQRFYESDRWVNELSPRVGALLLREKSIIHRLDPTSLSPMQ